jgi:signal transduction histidine kinase
MKTPVKVAISTGIVFTVIILIMVVLVYFFVDEYAYVDFYKRLETRVRITSQYHFEPENLNSEALLELKNRHLEKLENEKEYIVELNDTTTVSAVSASHRLPEIFVRQLLDEGKATTRLDQVFFAGSVLQNMEGRFLVVVSAENYFVTHHLLFLKKLLGGFIAFVILVVWILTFYFFSQIFSPIKKIVLQVRQISTENIHLRLEDKTKGAEIAELIETFNDLLNRIETSFETQKNFISNASHELGTPLTAIIGETDVALLKSRSSEEYQISLQNISLQAERLDQITKSLLFLAQTGYKGKSILPERLRIDEVILETKEIIDRLNPENKIIIDLNLLPDDPMKLKVKGNRQLLQMAFANVLNNACKYSGNKEVFVFIASTDQHIIVTIKDQGIGIPREEIKFIYDPFFRASNTKLYEGYGIGLPLTRNVIHLHHGELLVSSEENKGTVVQVKLLHFKP